MFQGQPEHSGTLTMIYSTSRSIRHRWRSRNGPGASTGEMRLLHQASPSEGAWNEQRGFSLSGAPLSSARLPRPSTPRLLQPLQLHLSSPFFPLVPFTALSLSLSIMLPQTRRYVGARQTPADIFRRLARVRRHFRDRMRRC